MSHRWNRESMTFGPRRAAHTAIGSTERADLLDAAETEALESFDLAYRTLVAILYNWVPRSGHPGGSISMGRIIARLLLSTAHHDISDPLDRAQDHICLAAGHKALGLYAALALRDEMARIAAPDLLASQPKLRVRIEDLLGFRRNPVQDTALFTRHGAKPLDGHPTPATPFVKLATGPSGVGFTSAVGLALALADTYGPRAVRVHVIEGEGGMTTGRVSEAMAIASGSGLSNLVVHLDHNQSTIDVDRCCREGSTPGDYVQWEPAEMAMLHDFNVVTVADGFDLEAVAAAQALALDPPNDQPTCIVYRTVKGWRYGIEGRASHGAGHGFCSEEYHQVLEPFEKRFAVTFPRFDEKLDEAALERGFFETLTTLRGGLKAEARTADRICSMVQAVARSHRDNTPRPRPDAPDLTRIWRDREVLSTSTPETLTLEPGSTTTLRGQLGRCLGHIASVTGGGVLGGAADLLDSTSVSLLAGGSQGGFLNPRSNPSARLVCSGGICEDALGGVMSGVSTLGNHLGVSSSYAAFSAPLTHISARCHAIGQQAKRVLTDEGTHPMVIVMGHSSIKTGEDGPTHADPQPLQMYQENFPPGSCITLTPTEPAEVWPLLAAALEARPAVIAAFVTRPTETVVERAALRLGDASGSSDGLVRIRCASDEDPTVVLQGAGVCSVFYEAVLPVLDELQPSLNVVMITSVELFDRLEPSAREGIMSPSMCRRAMGITDFTPATLHRFVTSEAGRRATLHPFRSGHFLGSGPPHRVMQQAGLDAERQVDAIRRWVDGGSKGR